MFIFSCFYRCFDGLGKSWDLIFILVVVYVSVCYLPNYNIDIQIKQFGFVFSFHTQLVLTQGD